MLLKILSQVFGWIAFTSWSISFYPQLYVNYKQKNVDGLSVEFELFNGTGFLFYSIFNMWTYTVQHRDHLELSVDESDLFFAFHAFLITFLTIIQYFYYSSYTFRINKYYLFILCGIWLIFFYNIILSSFGVLPWIDHSSNYKYSFAEYLGDAKGFITFIKYVPQVYLNYKRKSTVGWSITNIILDITGGILSFIQQTCDAVRQNDTRVFTSDIPKLLLSVESIFFDLIFLFQHYILYRQKAPQGAATEPEDDLDVRLIKDDTESNNSV